MARLKEIYHKDVIQKLRSDFSYANIMEVPKIVKVVVNMGLGEAIQNVKILDSAAAELAAITGQKSVITKAKKSIATFKLRQGMPIGCMVTLRRAKMYEFLDRLINIALPRTRDFRGVNPKGFDGSGNFNMGVKEHIIFPEIDIDKVNKIFGMDITFVTSTSNDEEAKALLTGFGFPFVKN